MNILVRKDLGVIILKRCIFIFFRFKGFVERGIRGELFESLWKYFCRERIC